MYIERVSIVEELFFRDVDIDTDIDIHRKHTQRHVRKGQDTYFLPSLMQKSLKAILDLEPFQESEENCRNFPEEALTLKAAHFSDSQRPRKGPWVCGLPRAMGVSRGGTGLWAVFTFSMAGPAGREWTFQKCLLCQRNARTMFPPHVLPPRAFYCSLLFSAMVRLSSTCCFHSYEKQAERAKKGFREID